MKWEPVKSQRARMREIDSFRNDTWRSEQFPETDWNLRLKRGSSVKSGRLNSMGTTYAFNPKQYIQRNVRQRSASVNTVAHHSLVETFNRAKHFHISPSCSDKVNDNARARVVV